MSSASRLFAAHCVLLCALFVWEVPRNRVDGAETGQIAGHVRLGLKRTGRPLGSTAYAARQIVTPGAPGPDLANVLVWLRDAPRAANLVVSKTEIRQQDEMFVPHLVAITVGSTVQFPNDDPYFHNVFSLSRASTFDLGRYPKGDSRSRIFTKPGIVKVFCNLHSHMSALVAVFDHPYFAQVSAEGTFTIDRVPAGTYSLTAWHERAGETDVTVKVEPAGTTRLEVIVPVLES
jgi:plastocyanin